MDTQRLVNHVEAEGARLADAAARAGWGARVPSLRWNVGELVRHTGGVHRWVDELLSGRVAALETAGELTGSGLADADLLEWFTAGVAALLQTMRGADPDLQVPTLLRTESPLRFWARRQAHETAIHRADAEGAAGERTPFDADLAQDGIGELLVGFARARSFAVASPGTLALVASDGPCWLITFGGERNDCRPSEDVGSADVAVRGRSSELYRWVWNRTADVEVVGEAAVAARWAGAVQIRRG